MYLSLIINFYHIDEKDVVYSHVIVHVCLQSNYYVIIGDFTPLTNSVYHSHESLMGQVM